MALEATEEGLDTTASEELATEPTEAQDETEILAEGDEPTDGEPQDESGQPRDEKGRFQSKAPSGDATGEEPTEVAAESAEPEPEVKGEPFSFKANKQDYPIEGAVYIPGEGLAIPEEQIPFVKQLLSEGAYFRTNWRQLEQGYQQKIKDLESNPRQSESEERANAILKELDGVLSDPEKLIEFAARLEVEGPLLKERARAQLLESKLKTFESQTQSAKEKERNELLAQQKDEAWRETFQTLKADKAYAFFGPEDWKAFEEEMSDLKDALFVVQHGETYLNEGQIIKAAQRRGQILSRVGKQANAVSKAVEFNAKRNPKPPAAPQLNAKVSAATEEEKAPASWDEWKKRNGLY